MRTAISVDWDFFVPENPLHDMSHQESLLFLNLLWQSRIGLVNEISTTGVEIWFWKWLRERVDIDNAKIHISESHTFCYNACTDVDRVVLFDAHHDCWNQGGKPGCVMCHDWARHWLREGFHRMLTWVKPGHELCSVDQIGKDVSPMVNEVAFDKDMDLHIKKADAIYICRSGCWTPPWLDQAFIDFVNEGLDVSDAVMHQDGDWDPLTCRWTPEQTKALVKQQEKMMEHFKALRAMT